MISLVGITGPARHGKDTVGNMLMKHMPAAERFAFADKIKEFLEVAFEYGEHWTVNKEGDVLFMTYRDSIETAILNVLHESAMRFGIDPKEATDKLVGLLKETHGNFYELHDGRILFVSSWRKMLQLTGTEWGRQGLHKDFWTSYCPNNNTIITDVRGHGDSPEPNAEAAVILARGGVVIKVIDPRKGDVVRAHASEHGIDETYLAATIINDGTLEDLEDKVCTFLYSFLLEKEHD
jgi:hypothetical protein